MSGDLTQRNQNLYCTYHQDKGYTIEQCTTFKDYLEQLVKAGLLREYMVDQGRGTVGQASGSQGRAMPPPPDIIEVIHAALIKISTSHRRGILRITPQQEP